MNPAKAKRPRLQNGVLMPTASSIRYDSYRSAKTTKEFFRFHCGTEAEKRRDFYHDVRSAVFTFDQDMYAKMRFLFAVDTPPPDIPAGEAAYYMLVTSGM